MNLKTLTLLLWFCLTLWACASSSRMSGPDGVIIRDIPFYPQADYQCGPASLAGVLNYWGLHITPEEIAKDIFSRAAAGTLTLDMTLYAQRKGLSSREYSGSLSDLKEKIDAGFPLVVMVDNGISLWHMNHFMAAVGYNDNGVIVNSGKTEHELIDFEEFLRCWKRTDFWSLLIKKNERLPGGREKKQ